MNADLTRLAAESDQARAPAFLVECLFGVWLAIRHAERDLKVIELPLVKLTGRRGGIRS